MGCVSSNLMNQDDEFTQLGSSALGHHIVSLTSTTYGLLNLDPSPQPTTTPPTPPPLQPTTTPPTPPPPFTLGSNFSESKSLWSEPRPVPSRPDVINSWELMSGLDADRFRISPFFKRESLSKPPLSRASLLEKFQADTFNSPNTPSPQKENDDPNLSKSIAVSRSSQLKKFESGNDNVLKPSLLDKFEQMCPPNGENRVVIYTTTLRGIRKTYEDCKTVRSAIESFGVAICERDISMDQGFREELRELMKGKEKEKESASKMTPPRVFIKGFYIGGAEEVMRIMDEGWFGDLLEGLPKKSAGEVCDGCGDARFLPCFRCSGSCKMAVATEEGVEGHRTVVVRCTECNENGLVHCPVCS